MVTASKPSGAVRKATQRSTRQGAVVQEALSAEDAFRSAQDVYAALRASGQGVGLSTVYRHLQGLVTQGVADMIHTADGETVYRFCGPSGSSTHHHHLVCRQCGRAEEIEGKAIERWASDVARQHGYDDVDHTVEIFGLCPRCRGK